MSPATPNPISLVNPCRNDHRFAVSTESHTAIPESRSHSGMTGHPMEDPAVDHFQVIMRTYDFSRPSYVRTSGVIRISTHEHPWTHPNCGTGAILPRAVRSTISTSSLIVTCSDDPRLIWIDDVAAKLSSAPNFSIGRLPRVMTGPIAVSFSLHETSNSRTPREPTN